MRSKLVKAMFKTRRRGVVSVLAMMFMVMFASLGVALAIVSQGNLRTAETHQTVSAATSSAETGLAIATSRLKQAVARFEIDKGSVDATLAGRLWTGGYTSADGVVRVKPATGYLDVYQPQGLMHVLMNMHAADTNVVTHADGVDVPGLYAPAAGDVQSDEATNNWVRTPTLPVSASVSSSAAMPPSFRVWYIPLTNGNVRVRVTGYGSVLASGSAFVAPDAGQPAEGTATTGQTTGQTTSQSRAASIRPLQRTIEQDFRIVKQPKYAILGSQRMLFGRGAQVTGNIGSTYQQFLDDRGRALDSADPVVARSEFYGLSSVLDAKLDAFFDGVKQYDSDYDNRLRPGDPTESQGIPSSTRDFDGDGQPDGAFDDVTGDGYVDDYDIFLKHYDANRDGRVTLSAALTAGTPAAGQPAEFTVNDDLALLIDSRNPDRNRNGVYFGMSRADGTSDDANTNGRWDAGESIPDAMTDALGGVYYPDVQAGWRDGWLDRKDRMSKINGRVMYSATWSQYSASLAGRMVPVSPGSSTLRPMTMQDVMQGGIVPQNAGEFPVEFGVGSDELREVGVDSFTNEGTGGAGRSTQALVALRPSGTKSLWQQAGEQLGVSPSGGQTWEQAVKGRTPPSTPGSGPRFWSETTPNATVRAATGQNIWEPTPFSGMTVNDYYARPRFENMTFRYVEIPQGLNGLFVNCTFVGVTWVRTQRDNTWTHWALYGQWQMNPSTGQPAARNTQEQPIDKSDYARWYTDNGLPAPTWPVRAETAANYAEFSDPPRVGGAWVMGPARDTKARSNNLRFHSCTIVGSVVSDTPAVFEPVRNKMQFTGRTVFALTHPTRPSDSTMNPNPADLDTLRRSMLMTPNYSIDLGQYNAVSDLANPTEGQNVRLSGTIVAGVLDARGNVSIDGSVMLTYSPRYGEGPMLQYGLPVGNPGHYNSSFGYFGSGDGDLEGGANSYNWRAGSMVMVNDRPILGWDLDADGIPDVVPPATLTPAQQATAVPIYFNGPGRVSVRWNPDIPMPDGILLPLSAQAVALTYREVSR